MINKIKELFNKMFNRKEIIEENTNGLKIVYLSEEAARYYAQEAVKRYSKAFKKLAKK